MLGVFGVVSGHSQQRRDRLHAAVAVVTVAHLDGVGLPAVADQRIAVSLASWAAPSNLALASQGRIGSKHRRSKRHLGQSHVAVHPALGDLLAPLRRQRGKRGALNNLQANVDWGLKERHHNLECWMVERLLQIFEYRGKLVCKGALLSKQCSGLV